MSTTDGLTAVSLQSNLKFNWVFLVELIVCGIVTLFFLFYFNRVFATIVSYCFRLYTWRTWRVYIDIQALQISLLGGRIFFKGLRYHGNNETILIHSGFVTWSYWLRNVRDLDVGPGSRLAVETSATKCVSTDSDNEPKGDKVWKAEEGGLAKPSKLPCRLNITLHGAEWFVYNRSAAYDAVLASIEQNSGVHAQKIPDQPKEGASFDFSLKRKFKATRGSEKGEHSFTNVNMDSEPLATELPLQDIPIGEPTFRKSSTSQTETTDNDTQVDSGQKSSFILRFLPVHIECTKAAVVLGNENTKSVLITKVEKASGEIDATRPSSSVDQYRQLINFEFEHPVIQMKPNHDYKEDQTTAAIRIKRGIEDEPAHTDHHAHSHSFFHRQRRKAWHKVQDLVPAFRSSVESFSSGEKGPADISAQTVPGQNGWQGLSRYLNESEQDDKARWSSIEYATVSTVVDCPKASMCFYWDVPGAVPQPSTFTEKKGRIDFANVNGSIPPEWGIKLSLNGATINYGPWADRQRADLQRVFFPTASKDDTPMKSLLPGQLRIPTEFKLYIELDEETTLRVPIREESKNWKWAKQADSMAVRQNDLTRDGNKSRKRKTDKGNPGPEIRPFGWLDVKVAANATVVYSMDMIAGPLGFSNKLELDLPKVEINTSVNHGVLWKSADSRITCDLSNPLQWNGHHLWKFDVTSDGLELFILREHVFLLTDLVDDWASGPPPEYLTFSPFLYMINLQLKDFRIYLNVNDSNIINNPSDFDDNTFISIFGSFLNADIHIPLNKYRPDRNDISFNVDAKHGGLNLHVPPWNTQATFLCSTEIAQLETLDIHGTYQYCATTSISNTDTLLLDVHGNSASCQFYGFVIRYFLKIKDNYFGEDIRFKTLEEYQDVLRTKHGESDEDPNGQPHKKSNDLDVILSVSADDSRVILPANLYSAKNHTCIEIATLAADLRFTNYYMDLEVVLSSLAFSQGTEDDGAATPLSTSSSTQLFIDGVSVTGNRLFGLPPAEPTYVCNWDFAVGAITGECTMEFFARLVHGARAFGFSFDDDENALPSISELILHDVTFLRATVESLRMWLHVEEAAFLLSTGTIAINFNDWAGSHYSKKLTLQLPDLKLACVDAESASRHRSRTRHPVDTHALIQTTIYFVVIDKKLGFIEDRQLQQDHVKRHDQRTHRTNFLLHSSLDEPMLTSVDPPAMCVPPMPLPVFRENFEDSERSSMASNKVSCHRKNGFVERKSSFLSASSISQKNDKGAVRRQSPSWAEELPIESRSRSRQTGTGLGNQIYLRDVSASTGRQSSFYSAVGEHKGLPPSTVTFSSPYIAPYFPLEGVEPDAKDLPTMNFSEDEYCPRFSHSSLDDINTSGVDAKASHTSFILELPSGITGVLNPKAISAVAGLMSAIQAVEPVDILDELQIDSMNQIFDLNKRKIKSGSITDFSVQTPGIKLRFLASTISDHSRNTRHDMHDQYDFSLANLKIAMRSKILSLESGVLESARKSSAFHFSLLSAGISAKERFNDIDDAQAAVNAAVEDVVFWAASNDNNVANLVVKDIEVTTASSKVEYLASLVHRTTSLADNLKEKFASQRNQQKSRVQLFTYIVATNGQGAKDPLFLTRPSYVLRSAPDHLRISDSWKIVTRLHHMYASLDSPAKHSIAMRCLHNAEAIPDDAQRRVFEGFSQWRSWDLNNINACLVMGKIYGSVDSLAQSVPQSRPSSLSFRTERFRLILDPGPKQNEISLSVVTTTVESKESVLRPEHDPQTHSTPSEMLVVQVFCADASINLNWELCELADDILRLYHQSGPHPESPSVQSPVSSHHPRSHLKRNMHVIIGTEKGSIILDTINIRAVSISKELKCSYLMTNGTDNGAFSSATFTLAADAATSKIRSHSQELTLHQLRQPSVYISYQKQVLDDTHTNFVKVAGNCQELTFIVQQDVLALIEVLDLVIGDEVAELHRLKGSMPSPKSTVQVGAALPPIPASVNKVNVALFLDMYHISIPLLQSLVYNVSGAVARASVAAQLNSELVFDFDIKEHSHDIQTTIANKAQSISLLQMPPTNGRITTHMSEAENSVSIFASVEPVELDAAAIHSLLTAINRPEVSSVLADIKDDLKGIQDHIYDIFGRNTGPIETNTKSSGKPFIYDAHLTLAGFDVFATAMEAESDLHIARLDFNLGSVQVVFANRLEQQGPVLAFPELRIGLRQIMFELSRLNSNAMEPCGNLSFAAFLTATSKINDAGAEVRSFHLKSDALEVNLFAETASSVVDVMGHLQDKIKDLDLSREKNYFRKLRQPKPRLAIDDEQAQTSDDMSSSSVMFASMYSLELLNIQVSWLVGAYKTKQPSASEIENLVLSLKRVDLSTRKENSARLTIEDLQLQMVPSSHDKSQRSLNSALLPEVIFNVGYVSTADARRFAFQAAGKSLNLRLTSQFIIPAAEIQKSIRSAADKVRRASASWLVGPPGIPSVENSRRQPFFGTKRMESLLVDADFAGAVVYLSGKKASDVPWVKGSRVPQPGRYGQFTHTDDSNKTTLRAPGLAWKVEYKDNGIDEPSLNAEVKVDASSNTLHPTIVPLIMEITSTVKEVVSNDEEQNKTLEAKASPQKFMSAEEDNILTADPSAVLGRTRLNLGLRICKQEFSLTCQPIARVTATARFDDIYLTVNTVRSTEHGHFFAVSAAFTKLQVSVQHVYSRESTGSFDVDSVFLSLMNSKHVSGTSGVSAILKISPMKVLVNAKQLQDFLLFREIWVPPEIRQSSPSPAPTSSAAQSQTFLVQRYQQVAATGAFPWNATVSIAELDVQLDLGQALGKSAFMISNFWVSSKKNSDWEQNLCMGFDKVGVDSTGRMSGFVTLREFKIRTSIQWPAREMALNQTPLVQGSLGFSQLRVKAAFDYQAFLVADITSFEFLMYNVRNSAHAKGDRLVAILDGEAVQVFCTTTTASQALALYQAFLRLVQEKRTNYETSLSEIERFLKRKSVAPTVSPPKNPLRSVEFDRVEKSPISLHTDVIVTLKAVNMGAFPNTFSDHQVFKLEALNAQARFAVTMDHGKIHSILGLTLGQLRIGLAGVKRIDIPKSVGDLSVEDVVSSATGSRGGTILKVPKVEAIMQTWQAPGSNHIDYIFKSSFEGKVEVGWNYSRISYIRGMWASHSKALAQRLGKPLPPSAVKITGVPDEEGADRKDREQQKITAEVTVPQSKYNYTALEPPIIETPQLRDMGEATPPLEWIGLHRDRLPNLTHQIVIVTLLELASEVEDAYGKILGSS